MFLFQDVRFISNHIPVFNPEECSFPAGNCSLVATAAKFGRIFVACGTQIKGTSRFLFHTMQDYHKGIGSELLNQNLFASEL